MSTEPQIMAFEAAAERVLRRVVVRRTLAFAVQTLPWALVAVGLALAIQFWGWGGGWLAVLAVLGWLAVSAVWSWYHKPGKYEALALWDQVRQASEAFASAWWYGAQTQRTPLQQRHLDAQALELTSALPNLASDLPLPHHRGLWLAPALAFLGLGFGLWHGRVVREESLTDAMMQAAVVEAKGLSSTDWQKKRLEGLTEAEKQEVEKLRQDVSAAANELQTKDGKSAREVLKSLEKRAHETEKLAKKLGSDGEDWASEKLVIELRKHADTADLGDAVANKNAAMAAKAAGDLALSLKNFQGEGDLAQRLDESLKDARKQAEEQDRKRVVGSHVIAAGEDLEATKVSDAAREFDDLAAALRDLARREQSRKELEKLAQQLRDAGGRIAGNQGGGLQQMQATGQQTAGGAASAPNVSQAPLQPPGLAQAAPQSMIQAQPQAPGDSGQTTQMAQIQPGQASQDQDKPTLFAPVPGQKPDKPPETIIMGKDGPKDEDGPKITLSMPGSPQAGSGTAKVDAAPTAPQKVARDAQVNAARGNEGTSSSRSVEGGVRDDGATRAARQTAVDFIQQQEAALDDASLPPARRDQVRRYFSELRKRFEDSGK